MFYERTFLITLLRYQMGKKKFIDKKKAATFQLFARDSSDPVYHEGPENDHVFVRVDNNPVSISGLDDNHDGGSEFGNDPNSIFAGAPDDVDGFGSHNIVALQSAGGSGPLPDHVRREILELGFPDDGYDYLIHLREIRNTGGGSSYYHNPKANLHDLPYDVKVKIFFAVNNFFLKKCFLHAMKENVLKIIQLLSTSINYFKWLS